MTHHSSMLDLDGRDEPEFAKVPLEQLAFIVEAYAKFTGLAREDRGTSTHDSRKALVAFYRETTKHNEELFNRKGCNPLVNHASFIEAVEKEEFIVQHIGRTFINDGVAFRLVSYHAGNLNQVYVDIPALNVKSSHVPFDTLKAADLVPLESEVKA